MWGSASLRHVIGHVMRDVDAFGGGGEPCRRLRLLALESRASPPLSPCKTPGSPAISTKHPAALVDAYTPMLRRGREGRSASCAVSLLTATTPPSTNSSRAS